MSIKNESPATMTPSRAIDPEGCGCTECLTGEYTPLEKTTRIDRIALLLGIVTNNTGLSHAELLAWEVEHRPDEVGTIPAPEPERERLVSGMIRWHCADGLVVADTVRHDGRRTEFAGVYVYPRNENRLVRDPAQLAAALLAASAEVARSRP